MYSVERLLRGEPAGSAAIDHPIEHLVACHERIEERLKAIERAVANLEERPAEARQTLASAFRFLETSGVLHTRDEEESFFSRLQGRLGEEEAAYLAALEAQHREAEAVYTQLKNVPANGADLRPYRETAARFCELYRAHIASENDRLVAVARRALNASELAEITAEMRARRAPAQTT
jgi:hemerythrin-like domain-containing protein